MTAGERQAAWSQLRAWVTWLHDRYELGTEERLPRCWAEHPGLVEELWALKAWREEIYQADQPSEQAARYWHAELRQVIHAATTFYAAGCRTGHRGARDPAAQDASLQQSWAAASPLAGVPAADLTGGQQKNQPGQWLSTAAIAEALDTGTAHPLSAALPDWIHFSDAWWRPGAGGWTRITSRSFGARLDACAAQIAAAQAGAAGPLAIQAPSPDGDAGPGDVHGGRQGGSGNTPGTGQPDDECE